MAILPPEIWSRIADCLTVREAARLTRVCTNAFRLELRRLHVYHSSYAEDLARRYTSPEGYSWAAKRWSNATELQMCLPCNRAMDQAWIMPMIEAACEGLRALEVLYFRCYEHNHQQSFEERHSFLDFPLWAIMLEFAPRLRVLHLVCYSIRKPVSMHSLQHIILTLGQGGEKSCKTCMSCIMSAGNLKTLHLECRALHMRLGCVDLTPLRKLTAVSLRYVMPTSLVLPEQCALSVKVHGLEDAEAAVWLSVRQHLKCFNVTAGDEDIESWQDFPAILRGESAPERMSWTWSGEKSASEFQKDAFPEISFYLGSMRGRHVMDLVSHRDLGFVYDRDSALHYHRDFNKIPPKWGCYCQACCSCLRAAELWMKAGPCPSGWTNSEGDSTWNQSLNLK